jgi:hypothetical protein
MGIELEALALRGGHHGRVALGGFPPRAPTDPDVRISRIRLFETQFRYATQMAWTIRGRSSG